MLCVHLLPTTRYNIYEALKRCLRLQYRDFSQISKLLFHPPGRTVPRRQIPRDTQKQTKTKKTAEARSARLASALQQQQHQKHIILAITMTINPRLLPFQFSKSWLMIWFHLQLIKSRAGKASKTSNKSVVITRHPIALPHTVAR